MAQVAVFGGSFDPPHNGHALCISSILNSGLVDRLLLVPTGDDRHDKAPVAAAVDRRVMLELMLKEYFGAYSHRLSLETVQVETKLAGSFTIDLLKYLESKSPQDQFLFVVGADNLKQIATWKDGAKLLERYSFLVISRLGEALAPPPGNIKIIQQSAQFSTNISSSALRDLLAEGKVVAGMLAPTVENYIRGKRLYIGQK